MGIARIILSVIQVICCLLIMFFILFQSGSKAGLGTISGGSESFMSKNKAGTFDAKLLRATITASLVFGIATVAINVMGI